MKAALNGCLNLSVLDGWWDEWFEPDFGWAIPTADGVRRSTTTAATTWRPRALYELLETAGRPRASTTAAADGLPGRWIEMVRQTLTLLGPKVLAGRMVREYVERLYAPAARAHRALAPDAARELAALEGPGPRGLAAGGRRPCGDPDRRRHGGTAELGSDARPARPGRASAASTPTTSRCRPSRAGWTRRTASTDATAVPLKPARGPRRRRAAGSTRARSPSTAPAPSATRSASCPPTACWRPRPELGLVALPSEDPRPRSRGS